MDSEFKEWMYLVTLADNFQGLIYYFFTSVHQYAPWIKGAAQPVIYVAGVIFLALRFVKFPIDRFKAFGIGFAVFVLSSILISGTTRTNNLGSASGTELTLGGYYSYYAAGWTTQMFNDTLDNAWASQVIEAAGGGPGMVQNSLNIAWVDTAQQFADKYIQGEGKDAYVDYHAICATEALSQAKTNGDKAVLESIGIGSNSLGMSTDDATTLVQFTARQENGDSDVMDRMTYSYMSPEALYASSKFTAQKRSEGEVFLQTKLIEANNRIDGTKGYRIPTSEYYDRYFNQTTGNESAVSYSQVSNSPGRLSEMLPNGATDQAPDSEQDFIFYPQNCYDLYLVASATMANFRDGVKNFEPFKNLDYSKAFNSISAARSIRRGVHDEIQQRAAELGIPYEVDSSLFEDLADSGADFTKYISSKINKWMLEYQIPATITSMALLVVILIITFPVFAAVSVMTGHQVLVTYLKLMFLPFVVVFIHKLFLTVSTNIIAYNNAHELLQNTYFPGGIDTPAMMAAGNIKAIVFGLITVAELAIAKFILWDDVRAITNFSPSQFVKNAMSQGMEVAGKAAGTVVAPISAGGRIAAAVGSRSRAIQSTSILKSINKSLQPKSPQRVAPSPTGSGSRSGSRTPIGGGNGSPPRGGGSTGSKPPLIPE